LCSALVMIEFGEGFGRPEQPQADERHPHRAQSPG
jgi:hypothetical protein